MFEILIYLSLFFNKDFAIKNTQMFLINQYGIKPKIEYIEYALEFRGIDPFLIVSMITLESSWNIKARGKANEIGLLQIIPYFWLKKCGLKIYQDLYNPYHNINCGVCVLKIYKGIYKKGFDFLSAYNGRIKNNKYAEKVLFLKDNLINYLIERL